MLGLQALPPLPESSRELSPELSSGISSAEVRFRDYRLLPCARILLKGRTPVAIGSRAFDILHILASSRGCIVDKREIVDHVWPTTTVEESNLRFQVAQLRKALTPNQDIIKTIPGRGYLLALESAGGHPDAAAGERGTRVERLHGAEKAPMVHVVGAPEGAPSDPWCELCPEAQVALQALANSFRDGTGSVVILLVRPAH